MRRRGRRRQRLEVASDEAGIERAAGKLRVRRQRREHVAGAALAIVYGRQRRGDLHEFWKNDKNFRDRELAVAKECFALLQARHASGEWELGRW